MLPWKASRRLDHEVLIPFSPFLVKSIRALWTRNRQKTPVAEQRRELILGTIVAQTQSTLRVTPFTATTIQLRRVPVIALHSLIPRGCPSPVLRSISEASMTPNGRECIRGCTSQKMGKICFAAYASILTLATNGILLPFSK